MIGIAAELQNLHARLNVMFDRVDEQLADTVNALVLADQALAVEVRTRDRTVDAMELEHDRHCIHILNTYRPQHTALRTVIAALRISANLERIGDQCKNVCKVVPDIGSLPSWQSRTSVLDIADAARRIMRSARDAFAQQDRLMARQVLAYDRQVDRAYRDGFAAIAALGPSNGSYPVAILHLAAISKSLERIADHAKSIARHVVYFVDSVDIRYGSLQAPDSAKPTVT